eukprot:CAMPEP_0172500316 /NCGR_PEP_ID=MMETSP1066-20121228/136859_1 /TAXON_ID=671091 /ORGANISM="Coscinodiscus wailesii, Strain CCMP2513" /LENGTH=478 /DNA_ID=CAMNT_0013274489 /DNA_START=106 /DNA_END=1542 /DNA_ORIENTATION=-
MRVLGYPRLISVENFRTPNFELVADALYWMVHRYDPSIAVHEGIASEDDRVQFLTGIARAISQRTNIRLNTKKLYAADGYAVKELLKMAQLLNRARLAHEKDTSSHSHKTTLDDNIRSSLTSRLRDAKQAKILATQIIEGGARLHDLLQRENDDSQKSRQAVLKFLDTLPSSSIPTTTSTPQLTLTNDNNNNKSHSHIEKSIERIIQTSHHDISKTVKNTLTLQSEERSIQHALQKKRSDLNRCEKRLSVLKNVRPAFMDEYEKAQEEFQLVYDVYVERFRNLNYLESELRGWRRSEEERRLEVQRATKRMQKKLQEEELKLLRGEDHDLVMEDEEEGKEKTLAKRRDVLVVQGGDGDSSDDERNKNSAAMDVFFNSDNRKFHNDDDDRVVSDDEESDALGLSSSLDRESSAASSSSSRSGAGQKSSKMLQRRHSVSSMDASSREGEDDMFSDGSGGQMDSGDSDDIIFESDDSDGSF